MDDLQNICKLAPSTRYQGSKRRILPWLYENLKNLKFETVLDGFGGTASTSYLFKSMQKKVTFNDILLSNYYTGIALIENDFITLSESDLEFLLNKNTFEYPSFIQKTYEDIYYLQPENRWLDIVVFNINMLTQKYDGEILKRKKALSFHILFQACLSKRPFNLFHRKNLYLRLANVKRNFGNKTTWNTDFETLFLRFSKEISSKIFSNGLENKAICSDITELNNNGFDLIYLDPPYTRLGEKSPKDYHSLYHFLEGLVDYEKWPKRVDWRTKNRRLADGVNGWLNNSLEDNFNHLFEKFQDATIVLSYGEPGNPSIEKIKELLLQYKNKVRVIKNKYNYKLRRRNGNKMYEVLVIAT